MLHFLRSIKIKYTWEALKLNLKKSLGHCLSFLRVQFKFNLKVSTRHLRCSLFQIQLINVALKDLLKNQADVIRGEVANTIHRSSKDKYAQRR